MLDWSMSTLAEQANVSISTVMRFENGLPQSVTASTIMMMRDALVRAGIAFLADAGQGEGVTMRPRPEAPAGA